MGALSKMQQDDEPLANINIVPFVDVVLVLLIIFMLTATAIVRASFEVKLPKAASAGAKVKSTLNFVYSKEGELKVDGEVKSFDEAAIFIRAQVAKGETRAVIAADDGAQYGKVFDVIDLVKKNGINVFALDVERKAGEGTAGP